MRLRPLADEPFDALEAWPEKRWRRLQWQRLTAVLNYAYERLPFYTGRMEMAGIRPGDVRSPEQFRRLPLLRKAEVVAAMRQAGSYSNGMSLADPPAPHVLGMTSGTLGTGILSFPDAWRRATGDAACRAYWWAGLRPGMQMLMAAPAWHCMAVRQTRVAERLGVRCSVPWGTFLPRFAGNFLAALRDLEPEFVCLYLPMLYALLAECRQQALEAAAAFASVRSVLVGGAPLTAQARLRLKADLAVDDVFESAGSSEGLLAAECPAHSGLHYFVDVCHVEILDPASGQVLPPGRRGSVVLSTLVPHGSVHLRYDTEDVGEILPGPCPCGRSWPRLKIYGRRSDVIRVAGRELLWYDLRACLDQVPELVGIPCAAIRGRPESPFVHLALQRPPRTDQAALARRVEELVARTFETAIQVEWIDELPARWKGVTVIDVGDWRNAGG